MYSEDTETSITITVDQGLIYLLLPEQWNNGKPVRLALGLPDTSSGRHQAQLIVQEIELDYTKVILFTNPAIMPILPRVKTRRLIA